jgi:hypothetical protein
VDSGCVELGGGDQMIVKNFVSLGVIIMSWSYWERNMAREVCGKDVMKNMWLDSFVRTEAVMSLALLVFIIMYEDYWGRVVVLWQIMEVWGQWL